MLGHVPNTYSWARAVISREKKGYGGSLDCCFPLCHILSSSWILYSNWGW